MPRPALAALLAFALVAVPAAAQTQGAPSTSGTTPRALPGTGGANAVPDTGPAGNSGGSRGPANDPNDAHSGRNGESSTGTGPLQGGGGPQGQSSAAPGQR